MLTNYRSYSLELNLLASPWRQDQSSSRVLYCFPFMCLRGQHAPLAVTPGASCAHI